VLAWSEPPCKKTAKVPVGIDLLDASLALLEVVVVVAGLNLGADLSVELGW
jgi:hypothetical protein